ncbi:MAG: gliding motility-associated C-terminal domain-containing protein, partial [Mucilaginibacter sp.]
TLEDAEATVTINGQARVFAYSTQITLHTGDNPITILVTAPNGAQKSYTLTITKPGPPMRPASVKTETEENATTTAVTVSQALSPNGDGINDVLAVAGIENYPSNSLSVINSKGVQVATITNYNNQTNAFDGHSQSGTAQPAGTYFYLLQYKDGKETVSKSGYFVLKY